MFQKRVSNSGSNSSDPREQILTTLQGLPFRTYQLATYLLLQRLGYRHVHFLNREHLRGRTSGITGDFEVCWPTALGQTRILVVLKHESRSLQRRYVDELRARMLRLGFSEGILITTGMVSAASAGTARLFSALPITLVSGHRLAALMIENGLGVEQGQSLRIDKEFFRRLLGLRIASEMWRRYDG